jgi:hypothetical protein
MTLESKRFKSIAYIAITTMGMLTQAALAQHRHPPEHAQLHEYFYRGLIAPGSQHLGSCCGNRDCYPTQAVWQDGSWWAFRREDKTWVRVPDEIVLKKEKSPDGQAHFCATTAKMYCFIKPDMGV